MPDQQTNETESSPDSDAPVSVDTMVEEMAALRVAEAEVPADPGVETPTETLEAAETVEADPEEPAEEQPETDVKTDSALERIHAAEKQSRIGLDSERAELAKEKGEWAEKLAEFETLKASNESAAKQALRDPAGLLASHGLTDKADLMAAARQLYALAADDATPEQKALAQRTLRDRDSDSRLSKMEAENAKLREEMAGKEQATVNAENIKNFTDGVVKAVTDTSPILASMLKKSPAAARKRIVEHAEDLYAATGETPDAVDVIKTFEDAERKAFSDRGFDPDQFRATPEVKTLKAGEKQSPVSLGNNIRTPTKPPEDHIMSRLEMEESVLADMAAGLPATP